MNELALFAGAGGGLLGSKLLGWRTVCAVEIDPFARRVLLARQADKCLEPFPIWDDIKTFDGFMWRSHVDVVSGGFPCQDISITGSGRGLHGSKSGLWSEMARVVSEVQPTFVWVENVAALRTRGLAQVLWDLAALGYDAKWGIVGAKHVGAPHRRERMWICAHSSSNGHGGLSDASGILSISELVERSRPWETCPTEKSKILGMDDGLADRLDARSRRLGRIRCCGNGQVPLVVKLAWHVLLNMN